MSRNMSYCRFRNTLNDLSDCVEDGDWEGCGPEEKRAAQKIVKLCNVILEDFGHIVDQEVETEEEEEC